MVNAAPAITPTNTNQGVPTFNQGTIVAGTYYLTAKRYYGGAGTHADVSGTLKITLVGEVATLEIVEGTLRHTLTIKMASNHANAPAEEKVVCTSSAAVYGAVGSILGALTYDTGNNSITLYVPGTSVRSDYTLHP